MPVYEYRCEACGAVFDARRDVTDRDRAATCPEGHAESRRLLPMVAAARSSTAQAAPAPSRGMGGGGCGPGCACAS